MALETETACGPCDWFGYPGVRENGPGSEPSGPLTEDQRCSGCGELVCNRHPNPYLTSLDHFVSEHGEQAVPPEQGV